MSGKPKYNIIKFYDCFDQLIATSFSQAKHVRETATLIFKDVIINEKFEDADISFNCIEFLLDDQKILELFNLDVENVGLLTKFENSSEALAYVKFLNPQGLPLDHKVTHVIDSIDIDISER